jgi:hypothetical protein
MVHWPAMKWPEVIFKQLNILSHTLFRLLFLKVTGKTIFRNWKTKAKGRKLYFTRNLCFY